MTPAALAGWARGGQPSARRPIVADGALTPMPSLPDPHPAEMFVCSGCYSMHPRADIHVLPTWNEHVRDFVTTFRCARCWTDSLAWTRLKAVVLTEDTREKFCQFLARHDCGGAAELIRQASLEDAACQVDIVLDSLEAGRLVLSP